MEQTETSPKVAEITDSEKTVSTSSDAVIEKPVKTPAGGKVVNIRKPVNADGLRWDHKAEDLKVLSTELI